MQSLNLFSLSADNASVTLILDRIARWAVYTRLTDLAIPCQCQVDQPLQVRVDTPTSLTQVWSVVKTCTAPKIDLVDHLNRCWQQRIQP